MTRTSRRSDAKMTQRKRQILSAVIRCVAEDGIAHVTSARVAERADVSHGLVFYHFPTTKDLLKEALVFGIKEFSRQLEQQAAVPGSPAEFLTRAYEHASPFGAGDDRNWIGFWLECMSESNRNPQFRETYAKLRAGHTDSMLAAVRTGIADGRFKREFDANLVMDLIASLFVGLQIREVIDGPKMSHARSRKIIQMLLDLLSGLK